MSAAAQSTVRRVEGAANELRFEVEIGGESRVIWFRTEAPITDRADPAVPSVLLPAMRAGAPLRFADPLDPLLRRRVPDLVGLLASWRWLWSHVGTGPHARIEVEAPVAAAGSRTAGEEAAFFSGGVDGFFTALEVPEVTRLIYVTGLDTRLDDPAAARIRASVAEAADRLGKQLITVETNLRDLSDEWVSYVSYFGSALAAVAMALEPGLSRVYIPSSSTYAAMFPNGSHPLLDVLWSTSALELINHGSWLSRSEKLERMAENEIVRSSLRVCWQNPELGLNCGRCEKCLRTMTVLEAVGVLDRFATFPSELDLELVARTELVLETSGDGWRAVRALAERRGAGPDLLDAIDSCLASERPWVPDHGGDPFEALERAEAELAELRQRVEYAEAALESTDAVLREVLDSSSWRLTAPLRALRRRQASRDA